VLRGGWGPLLYMQTLDGIEDPHQKEQSSVSSVCAKQMYECQHG